jgi:hypothetical protein
MVLILATMAVSASAQTMIVTTRIRVDSTGGVPNIVVGDIFDLNFSVDLSKPNTFSVLDGYFSNAAIVAPDVTLTRSGLNTGTWDPIGAPPYAATTQASANPSYQDLFFDFRAGVGNQPVPGYGYLGLTLDYFSSTRTDLIMPASSTGAPLSTFLGSSGVDFSGFDYHSGWLYFSQGAALPQAAFSVLSTTSAIAVPEPSAYAMLAGVAALGLAGWRRRQRSALA